MMSVKVNKEVIVIPDVHGRDFWKDAVKAKEDKDIIFLGDYIDPYHDEGITKEMALDNFREILVFAIEHRENVTLLLGNHDLAYLFKEFMCCRHDMNNYDRIFHWYDDNKSLFSLAAERIINGNHFVFTHAGIMEKWIIGNEVLRRLFSNTISSEGKVRKIDVPSINELWRNGSEEFDEFMLALTQAPYIRGGLYEAGSLVWADVRDMQDAEPIPGYYQVFGHTQLESSPIITKHFACLDTRCAYVIDSEGMISPL